VVLGVPAIAVSQQSQKREMDFRLGREFDFTVAARFTARIVENLPGRSLAPGTLLNVNCPAVSLEDLAGARVTRLGKRIYRDKLELAGEDPDGGTRRRYRIYGMEPSYHSEEGTDFAAIDADTISVTPLHFDLTDLGSMEHLEGWDLSGLLAQCAPASS
jgi:5'-nucleotidase